VTVEFLRVRTATPGHRRFSRRRAGCQLEREPTGRPQPDPASAERNRRRQHQHTVCAPSSFAHFLSGFRQERAFFGIMTPSGGMRQLEGVAPEAIRRELSAVCTSFNERVATCNDVVR
jgi:hypothetical protein